ncbi:MAG TPA: metallophosphoesterase [Solirubrobacterales bacterium]|nr:metallophosphoesterase [Solirubrobacterales bacterium]
MFEKLKEMIAALGGNGAPGPTTTAPAEGAIVHQVLDPAFLHSQLEQIQKAGGGLLSDEQYQRMYADLTAAQASPVSGADATQGGQAYLPRSPAVSLLQSTLTDCIASRFEDLVKPLPPGKRSFGDFVLREEDVFRKFGPCDARWAESVISKGLSLLEGKPDFVDGRAPEVPIADNARLVVVGDWGTGLPGAQAVGQEMAKQIRQAKGQGREVHALHLGDVYYSGWKEEYQSRFMPYWPVRPAGEGVASWALNGNHDMYSGGHGYFGYLLRDQRFAAQNGSSYFCLQNSSWQLLGLDSAYIDDDLAGGQAEWVAKKQRESERKTMLLTHHEPFSSYVEVNPPMLERLKPAFDARRIDAWLWGHEHLCCVYKPDLHPYLGFGSCIGHGGVPVLLDDKEPLPPEVEWRAEEFELHDEDRWQLFGFAVLDFDGEGIEISYYNQQGGQPVHSDRIE